MGVKETVWATGLRDGRPARVDGRAFKDYRNRRHHERHWRAGVNRQRPFVWRPLSDFSSRGFARRLTGRLRLSSRELAYPGALRPPPADARDFAGIRG